MTTAALTPLPWAGGVDGFVVDPDTDATHPSGTGGPGKVARGWLMETEPQQWENWVINRYQSKMLNKVVSGFHQIDDGVTYKLGSLVWDTNGKIFRALAVNKGIPTTTAGKWEEPPQLSQAAWLAMTNKMATDYTSHIQPNVIKHGETPAQVNAYSQATIDSKLVVVQTQTNNHVLAHYPHHETAAQVGTIPITGGVFTGIITYRQGFTLSSFDEVSVCGQPEIAGVGAPNGAAFGVGYNNFSEGGRIISLVEEDSTWLSAMYGQEFVLPFADVYLPLTSDVLPLWCDFGSSYVRPGTLAYTDKGGAAKTAAANVPAFELSGMKLAPKTVINLTGWSMSYIDIATVSYHLNGVLVVKHMQFSPTNLQDIFGTSGNVRDVRVWFKRLTDRQVSNIP